MKFAKILLAVSLGLGFALLFKSFFDQGDNGNDFYIIACLFAIHAAFCGYFFSLKD